MDPNRRPDARYRRPREDQSYSMVKLLRHKDTVYAVTPENSEYDVEEKKKDLIPSLWCSLTTLAIFLTSLILHYYLYNGLPTPLNVNDLISGQDIFITERAKADLIGLAKIGVKVVGSYENEVLAVEYLNNHLIQIKAQATNNKSVEIDIARASGAYFLPGLTNVYVNVANIVARLSDGNSSEAALLVNCHYDSHPSSPGASDNGLNCAVMLEVLRVLSQSKTKLTHDIIFLFNGAEENPLQASHAYVTTHRWASDVRAFLNYDSAGFGGREALFQSGPKNPWLSAYYASVVPHPHASSVLTDIFESGLVPSDTDFRIFRDFGNLHGLDLAYYAGGHVYHTLFDDYGIIPDACFQHTGDNMMALVKALGNAPELLEPPIEGGVVYYDFLGWFVIRYSTMIALIINILTAILALAAPFWPTAGCGIKDTVSGLAISLLLQILGIALGFGLSALVGMLLDWTDNAMSWFSSPLLTIGLFVAPTMLPMFGINWALTARPIEQSRLGTGQRAQLNTHAVGIFWAIILIALTIYGLKSAYVIAMIVGFVAAANVITSIFKLQRFVRVWLAIYILVGLVIPTIYVLWLGSMFTSFLPIMGRSGSQIIPDLYISLLFALITSLIGSFWAPIIGVVRRPHLIMLGFSLATVLTILAATLSPLGFPYVVDPTNPKPQRLWLIHAERTLYDIDGNVTNNDAGLWIQNLDRNGPRTIEKYISEYSNATLVSNTCLDMIYCGLPVWKSTNIALLNRNLWIPSEIPIIPQYQPSSLVGVWNSSLEYRRLTLNVTGPDHMSFVFSPRDEVTLTNWSLLEEIPAPTTVNGRLVYFVFYSYAIEPELPEEIWVDVVISKNSGPVIDVTMNSHYVHNSTLTTVPYASILDQLPVWVAPLHWTATSKSYIF